MVDYLAFFQVKKHFSNFVSSSLRDRPMWFECDGIPLRWHLPIGVMYDQAALARADMTLPWNITVRFDKFPANDIIQYDTR